MTDSCVEGKPFICGTSAQGSVTIDAEIRKPPEDAGVAEGGGSHRRGDLRMAGRAQGADLKARQGLQPSGCRWSAGQGVSWKARGVRNDSDVG